MRTVSNPKSKDEKGREKEAQKLTKKKIQSNYMPKKSFQNSRICIDRNTKEMDLKGGNIKSNTAERAHHIKTKISPLFLLACRRSLRRTFAKGNVLMTLEK